MIECGFKHERCSYFKIIAIVVSSIQSGVADSQIDPNNIQENIYYSKLILLQSFYCLRLNRFIFNRVRFFDD